ncbi:MAG: VOC family protein [Candidatus Bathyarchaeia archaeon]
MLAVDLKLTCEELEEKNVEFSRRLGPSEWDEEMEYAMIKDPDGNKFWLLSKT